MGYSPEGRVYVCRSHLELKTHCTHGAQQAAGTDAKEMGKAGYQLDKLKVSLTLTLRSSSHQYLLLELRFEGVCRDAFKSLCSKHILE